MKTLSFFFFLGLFSVSESLRRQFRPGFINGIPLRDHYAKQFIDPDAYADCLNNPEKFNVKRFNFTQPLDHFNPSETRTWSQGTNVVLPNGSLDPWSTLGCNISNDNVHRKVRTTVGGAHCVDMYPYTANSASSIENPDVVNTINLVKQEVAYYLTLAGPFGGSNGVDTTPSTSMDTTTKAIPLILIFGFVLCFVKLL